MNDYSQMLFDKLLNRAAKDKIALYIDTDPTTMHVKFLLEKDGIYLCKKFGYIEFLESFTPPEVLLDHMYTKWVEELQNEINTAKGEPDHD